MERQPMPERDEFADIQAPLRDKIKESNNQLTILNPQGEVETTTSLDKEHLLGQGLSAFVLKTEDGKAAKIYFPLGGKRENPTPLAISNEIFLERQLNHPNIAKVFGVGKIMIANQEIPVIEKEIVPKSLEDILKERALSPEEALTMAEQIAGALQYIYEQTGEIIADLTPENIGQRDDGTWLIIEVGDANKPGRSSKPGFDILYSAPETIGRGKETPESYAKVHNASTPASEVYSLSHIIYQTLTKEKPDRLSIMFPLNENENVPDKILEVLQKGTDRNPGERFQTPLSLVKALKSVNSPETTVK